MNKIEKAAVSHLKDMVRRFGVMAIKAEFEAQGMELHELVRLKDIASCAGLGVALKVGGAEDVWGIKQALLVGVSGIIFPMVESRYALSKSLEAAKANIPCDDREDVHLAVNIETGLAFQNLGEILAEAKKGGLDAVTLGRVDLVGSLGLGRKEINSTVVYKIAEDTCRAVKAAGLMMTMGGGIETEAYEFIKRLAYQNILDRFETRMIIFPSAVVTVEKEYAQAVRAAHQFEMYFLDYLRAKYSHMAVKDNTRLEMLTKRVNI